MKISLKPIYQQRPEIFDNPSLLKNAIIDYHPGMNGAAALISALVDNGAFRLIKNGKINSKSDFDSALDDLSDKTFYPKDAVAKGLVRLGECLDLDYSEYLSSPSPQPQNPPQNPPRSQPKNPPMNKPLLYTDPSQFECVLFQNGCRIDKYIGNDSIVNVPETINGLPVFKIGRGAFSCKTNITEVYLPSALEEIGESAFSDCTSLKEIALGDQLRSVGERAFSDCTSLKEIALGDQLRSVGAYAFFQCEKLEYVVLPDSLTSLGDYAFSNDSSLKNVILGKSLKKIPKCCFMDCGALNELTIPEGVESIGGWAFCNCGSLYSLTLPKSLSHLGEGCFDWCTSLTTITYNGASDDWKRINKDINWKEYSSLKSVNCQGVLVEIQ